MTLNTQKARCALLVALGIAATTFSLVSSGTALADDSAFQKSFALLDSDSESMIRTIAFQSDEAADEAEAAKDGEDEESIEDRFAALDEQFASLEESIDEVAEVAGNKQIVKSGSSKSTMVVSGRIHFDAWGFDDRDPSIANFEAGGDPADAEDPDNRLGFRRVRFGVKGKIKDNMEYKIEMEFAGGNSSEFRDVYFGWNDLPFLRTLLLGNQKRPYGLDHLNSSRYNVFMERPFVIEANNQDARRLGLCSYGVSEDQAWNWRYGVFNQENVQATGNYRADHLQLEFAGRLANTVWYDEISGGRGYAQWAISGTHADSTPGPDNEARWRTRPEARSDSRWINTYFVPGADHFEQLGLEGVLNVGALQLVGEYQSVWLDRNGFADTNWQGGYVYASYFLTGEHMPWDRKSGTLARPVPFQNFWLVNRCDGCREGGWGAWQIAGRYSVADYNDEDIFGGKGQSFTFGLNWWWNPNARMQFNYITGEIKDHDINEDPAITTIETGRYDIYGARFMVDF
jgi:phosphate-selective porin OprO/OprP